MRAARASTAIKQVLEIDDSYAVRVSRWISHCGGVAVWGCLDLSTPSRQFFTPARLTDGTPSRAPHWSSPREPERIVTAAEDVEVVTRREAKRISIAVQRGYGLGHALTDASSARLHRALEDAGPRAVHAFEGGDAIIYEELKRTPLPQWLAEHPDAKAV